MGWFWGRQSDQEDLSLAVVGIHQLVAVDAKRSDAMRTQPRCVVAACRYVVEKAHRRGHLASVRNRL